MLLQPGADLPLHLLEEGWRKCWSRSYYFNMKTGQTLWYLMKEAAVAVAVAEYSEKKGVEGDYKSNIEVKLE